VHRSRIIILLGWAIALVAMFLPFVEFPSQGSINGFDGDAWPALVLVSIPALLSVLGDRKEGFRRSLALIAIASAGGAVVFAAFKVGDAAKAADAGSGSIGIASWLLIGGCVIALVGAVTSLTSKLA